MKPYYLIMSFILTLILVLDMNGQSKSPVSWTFDLQAISGDQYEVIATANMQKSWVLYSQFTDDNGPIPTAFELDSKIVTFEEKSKAIKEFDEMFDLEVIKFKDTATFRSQITKNNAMSINGSVTFMTCDGTRCLPPVTVDFDLKF